MPHAVKFAILTLSGALLLGCIPATKPFAPAPTPLAGLDTVDAQSAATGSDRQILVTIDNEPQLDLRRAGSTIRGYFSPRAYRASPAARQIAEQLGREYGLARRDAWPIRALRVHCVVYEVPAPLSRDVVIASLAHDPRVESVQRMQAFRVLDGEPYNDPYSGLQHNMGTLSVSGAHRWASGRGVRVGIVDTGIDLRHLDLAGKVVASADFVERDRHAFFTDRHGTAVAGVIAASANNRLGIVGVAPDARLVAAKACWYEPGDPLRTTALCSSFTLARALAFALELHVDVLNLSLTGPRDPLLERLVAAAISAGVVVVAAQPDGARTTAFPAGVDGVIAVLAAEDESAVQRSDGSLFAPGREILTLAPEDRYDYFSGSSVAAAHVSGIAALMREVRPRMTNETVREVLVRTSARGPSTVEDSRLVVNACAALADLVGSSGCPAVVATTATQGPTGRRPDAW